MKLELTQDMIKWMKEKGCSNPAITGTDSWRGLDVDVRFIKDEDTKLLKEMIADKEWYAKEVMLRRLHRKLNALDRLAQSGGQTTANLEVMRDLLIKFVGALPAKRVYADDHGIFLPYTITEIKLNPAQNRHGDYTPAYISMEGQYVERGTLSKRHWNIERRNLGSKGTNAEGCLSIWSVTPENKELNDIYMDEIKKYMTFRDLLGTQILVEGRTKPSGDEPDDADEDRYGRRWRASSEERTLTDVKMIIDDANRGKNSQAISPQFWLRQNVKDIHEDEELEEEGELDAEVGGKVSAVLAPIHPFIRVFNLKHQEFALVHVSNFEQYVYDTKLSEKLILSAKKKAVIHTLVESIDREGEDIIKGKSGGIIVLSSGQPGTGKTLTAETVAESTQKPLYGVQCSQLGVDAKALEKTLQRALDRAVRWNAVLLIDEADVYIHERGDDVNQNAIVGVFLRLLEYYKGILFLTTNRATIVDDAITSRLTAHVRYELPVRDERRQIWDVMCSQYNLDLDKAMRSQVADQYKISGRSIMKMVQLVKVLTTRSGKKATMDDFQLASEFQDLEKEVVE